MRSLSFPPAALLLLLATLTASLFAAPSGRAQPAAPGEQNPESLLGNIVVVAEAAGRPLPKIAVLPSLAPDLEDVTIRSVVRRDLDLCGEFEVVPEDAAPEGLYLPDSPVDVKAWAGKGVEAIVKVNAVKQRTGKVVLTGVAYFVSQGQKPVFETRLEVLLGAVREESHRVADALIGALTGKNGGFASHMTFAAGSGKVRRVFTIDADGHDPKPVSPIDRIAIAPAFGPKEELHYAASLNHDEFRLFSAKNPGAPVAVSVRGSIYGVAFSRDRSQVALAIATGDGIKMHVGPDAKNLQVVESPPLALHPTFTPSGKLAFTALGKHGQQVFVDGKAISPPGLHAYSPAFCNHSDGVRAVFSVITGRETADLVATSERGGPLVRLTQGQGKNTSPACSPDGRLVAFFSTRKSKEGPGLYVMRLDGGRPRRIATLLGDSLRWDPLPRR